MADPVLEPVPLVVVPDEPDDTTDWKAQARKWETRAKKAAEDAKAADDRARQQTLTEHEKAIEAARKEAADAARAEATGELSKRLVAAELRAAAGGLLADPADAGRFIDPADLDLDKDGSLDPKTAAAAIQQLIKDKPYLAANAARPVGTADGGTRGTPASGSDMNTLLRQAAGRA